MMDNSPAIKCERVTKHYKIGVFRRTVEALNDLDLSVEKGNAFAFIGLNGAGKTTTIKLLLDHARPTRGEVSVLGGPVSVASTRLKIGYLPDLPYFYRFLDARELLHYCGKLFGINKQERVRRIDSLLQLVGLAGRETEPLGGFSRGMLQRVGLAQALINDPELIILDEPLGGLDPIGRSELMQIMLKLKEDEKTIFFSSHILEDAQKIADRVGIIHKGRLLFSGPLEELTHHGPGWEVELGTTNKNEIENVAADSDWVYSQRNGRYILTIDRESDLKRLYDLAAKSKFQIRSVNSKRLNLEEVFLNEVKKWEQ